MSLNLNSLKGFYIGDYIGVIREFKVQGLGSKLLKGGSIGDYKIGVIRVDTRSLDYGSYRDPI